MLYLADSSIHGHGIFADKDYFKGDTIEMCPYLIVNEDSIKEDCILHNYIFYSPSEDDTDFLIPLGYAMIYNHSFKPNAEWEISETDNRFVRFFAVKDIKKDEEIVHDYGYDYWESRPE